ncbi:hypothetical protein AAHA92_25853 [Salvia divinorum]|uniref:PHD-type zinc finger plants domain-containing protein n=1 Tax=Salvia divinorum TaxID=28513 RepID=A0ABD1GF44_SALDI
MAKTVLKLHRECCDVCGDVGVADALITCSSCKRNTEHMYCMNVVLEKHVDNWECKECSMSKPSSSKVRKCGQLGSPSSKLSNESRKTKYISVEEAITLSRTPNRKSGKGK